MMEKQKCVLFFTNSGNSGYRKISESDLYSKNL